MQSPSKVHENGSNETAEAASSSKATEMSTSSTTLSSSAEHRINIIM
jgi:hypothetical protein